MFKKHLVVFCRVPFYALPLRRALKHHLNCFKAYGRYPTLYINADYGIPAFLLKKINIQGIVLHTSFLAMRWTPELFLEKAEKIKFLRDFSCPKIALPQDEFIHTKILIDFFNAIKITHVYSCGDEKDQKNIYEGLHNDVSFQRILTGYISKEDMDLAEACTKSHAKEIDVGYRTQHMPSWLGKHGALKIKIAEKAKELAPLLGLKVDISTDQKDIFHGKKWIAFLAKCRAVVGVEGGASIIDRDGHLRAEIERIEKTTKEPETSILSEKILKKHEGSLDLKAISPRHLEACLTRTYQILVEGEYNGIFQAKEHYYPLKKDLSNFQEALESLKDEKLVQKITEKAYVDIVASGKYTYKSFVEFIEKTALNNPPDSSQCAFSFSHFLFVSLLVVRNIFFKICNVMLGFLFHLFPQKGQKKIIHLLKRLFHALVR